MPTDSVVCEVPEGLGLIEVTGNDGASLLLIGGRPAQLEGSDCCGSIGWLASRATGQDAPTPVEAKALTAWLAAFRAKGRPRDRVGCTLCVARTKRVHRVDREPRRHGHFQALPYQTGLVPTRLVLIVEDLSSR
ncbi:hypothetical protein [Streptomyces sp. NPDC056883]|uniref:hypothetical protein n=1 Tax=Streptomyces sp. NPDC056883 TaxID=3345959 RepID=UPI0036B8B3FB